MVRICVREVSLTLVSYTHLLLVCGNSTSTVTLTYDNEYVVNGVSAMAVD